MVLMFLPGGALPVRDEEKNVLHITRLKAVLNALSDSHPSERAIAPMGSSGCVRRAAYPGKSTTGLIRAPTVSLRPTRYAASPRVGIAMAR